MTAGPPSFIRHGPAEPVSPIILSVPHAGRDYPLALRAALRVPVTSLTALEDRHVDQVALAARGGETLFVAQRARAWIDLNRSEAERDPRLDEGAGSHRSADQSVKIRSGLGLVPRRAGGADIWRQRLTDEEVAHRIRADHRPYHAALSATLIAARDRFGAAVLLDIHSMPPLGTAPNTPKIVFGDRFGKTASARLVSRLEAVTGAVGLSFAANAPYSGGHILERHAAPKRGIHAIQIEFDRSLYLDADLDELGPGQDATAALLRRMIDSAADELLPMTLAAE